MIFSHDMPLDQWLQAMLVVHGVMQLEKDQLDFIAPYLESPLTRDELRQLFGLAHSAQRGERPQITEEQGKLLLKLLDEQSPKPTDSH